MIKVYLSTTIPKEFRYSNGDLVDETFWGTYQPDNFGGNDSNLVEACVEMWPGITLNDAICSFPNGIVCE